MRERERFSTFSETHFFLLTHSRQPPREPEEKLEFTFTSDIIPKRNKLFSLTFPVQQEQLGNTPYTPAVVNTFLYIEQKTYFIRFSVLL